MSETFEKSQLSEFFDVSSGCQGVSEWGCLLRVSAQEGVFLWSWGLADTPLWTDRHSENITFANFICRW